MSLLWIAAAAVGLAAGRPAFHETPLADEAHITDACLDACVLLLHRAQPFLELLRG